MKKMTSAFTKFLALLLCISLLAPSVLSAADDSGTFRGKWWNYYDRALNKIESGDNYGAISDLKSAITKREQDQRMARTYGMHFIDYFPHRELGILYFKGGDNDKALSELEESVRSAESAKAVYYLNKARKTRIEKNLQGRKPKSPAVVFSAPSDGAVVRELSVKVAGRASGEGLISRIVVNNNPYRFEMAEESISFEKEVPLTEGTNRVIVQTEDLLGSVTEKELAVIVDLVGPTVNILEVASVEQNSLKAVLITGEVSDETGISRVVLDGRTVEVKGDKSYEFAVTIPYAGSRVPAKYLIQAFDSPGNETKAEIDIEKELIAFRPGRGWVQLAFNGNTIFPSDKEPPLIKLKETADLPPVFVDKYYIDGEVSDNKGVEKILVNGREVPIRKGRKIFFNKILNLIEGKNRIVIEALDGAGNKATSEIKVIRTIPGVLQVGSRMSVSVLPFEIKQNSSGIADLAYDHLIGFFVDQKRFNVIERAKLEQILQEQKIVKSKLSDPEHSIKVGRLMSAEAVLATSIREDGRSIEVISRVINTETSEVMEVKDVFSEDKGASAVKELMEGLAAKVAAGFPLAEGMVIKRDSREVYSDLGDTAKIRKNTPVIFYRKGREIKHPVTGKSLGFDIVKLGEGRIEEIQKDFSKVKIMDKPAPQDIHVKDMLITK